MKTICHLFGMHMGVAVTGTKHKGTREHKSSFWTYPTFVIKNALHQIDIANFCDFQKNLQGGRSHSDMILQKDIHP